MRARNATVLSTPKCTSSERGGAVGEARAAWFRRHVRVSVPAVIGGGPDQPSTTRRASVISWTA